MNNCLEQIVAEMHDVMFDVKPASPEQSIRKIDSCHQLLLIETFASKFRNSEIVFWLRHRLPNKDMANKNEQCSLLKRAIQSHIVLINKVSVKVSLFTDGVQMCCKLKWRNGKVAQPNVYLQPLLLTGNNFNTGMDRRSHARWNMVWNYLSIPKF